MLEELLQRLRLLAVAKRDEQWGHDTKELRAMIEAHVAEKHAELAQAAEAMSELDYMDAMTDSFAGGPDGGDGEGEADGEKE